MLKQILRHMSSTRARPPLLGRFKSTPLEIFRIQSGVKVKLRAFEQQKELGRRAYDLKLIDGLVKPKTGPNFEGPNGMSMRPNGPMFQEIVRTFRGRNINIYRVPEGKIIRDS